MTTSESLLDHVSISGCYLFPQARYVDEPFLVDVDGASLACYRRIVDPDNLTLVHFHGNGEAVADYVPWLAAKLERIGLNSLFVEYREYGGSTGKAQLAAMLGDGAAVLAAAGLPPEKVIAFGRSIGSLYAIELVHRLPSVAGLVLESGIADPSERFLAYADLSNVDVSEQELVAAARKVFDHQSKLSGYQNPLLILHTLHDGLVEFSHAERNLEWAGSRDKELVRFLFGDHNSIMGQNQVEYFDKLFHFARKIAGSD